jgi:hypothetical protein
MKMNPIMWVSTGGGPLIVIPVEIAHHWWGVSNSWPDTGYLLKNWEAIRWHTDYGRACGVDDYLGVLEVGPGRCLVLGDEPMQTTVLPFEGGWLIIRWVHAECEEDVVRAIQSIPENIWKATPHRIHGGNDGLLVFDSAFPGYDLPSTSVEGTVPWLKLPIPSGTYEIDIADYEPNQHTRLILHRLRPAQSDSP